MTKRTVDAACPSARESFVWDGDLAERWGLRPDGRVSGSSVQRHGGANAHTAVF